MKKVGRYVSASLALVLLLSVALWAQDLAEFEKSVSEHTLKNGLKMIIVERHDVPVVSFHTYANVGAVNEVLGITGMAHMFEHLAFKGTTTIGTKDYKKEKLALAKLDDAYTRWKDEQRKGARADQELLKKLKADFDKALEEASQLVVNNELATIIEQNGGQGLNATTSYDATRYFFNLPSNRLELWFSLESERFLNPVLRDFYKERDVVIEERRLRVESQPVGKLVENFLEAAFTAHPYHHPGIGYRSDLENLTRAQAQDFFRRNYSPANLTIAIVGDVDPKEAVRLGELYFGRIPTGPKPQPVVTVEPPQEGERRIEVETQAQPFLLIGFHKPDINDRDNAVYDAITDIIGIGRTSRLYKSLVRDKKIAAAATAFPGLPGQKYPNLFLFFAVATPGHTNAECEQAILDELEKLKKDPVTAEELARVKRRLRANTIRQLGSNSGLAGQLAFYQVLTGEWRNLFRRLEAVDKVTAEDIQRVARSEFTKRNRTVAYLEPEGSGKGSN